MICLAFVAQFETRRAQKPEQPEFCLMPSDEVVMSARHSSELCCESKLAPSPFKNLCCYVAAVCATLPSTGGKLSRMSVTTLLQLMSADLVQSEYMFLK